MDSTQKSVACLGVIWFLSFTAYAQSAGPQINHFAGDGISFDYPIGWSISDEGTPEAQRLILTHKGSSASLEIVAKRGLVLRNELPAAIENFTEPILKRVAIRVGQNRQPPQRTAIRTQVGLIEAEGVRLQVTGNTKIGEVIWLRMHFRLISIALVRSDKDESVRSKLWQSILATLMLKDLSSELKQLERSHLETRKTRVVSLMGKLWNYLGRNILQLLGQRVLPA